MGFVFGIQVTGLSEVIRDLDEVAVEVKDMKAAFAAIGRRAVAVAAAAAPHKSGRLAASVKARAGKNRVTVRAGSPARVPYAGVINFGWRKHHITGARFLAVADAEMRTSGPATVEHAIEQLIRQRNLQ